MKPSIGIFIEGDREYLLNTISYHHTDIVVYVDKNKKISYLKCRFPNLPLPELNTFEDILELMKMEFYYE